MTNIKDGTTAKLRYLNANFYPEGRRETKIVPIKLFRYIVDNFEKDIYSRCANEMVIAVDEVSNIEYFLRDGGACTKELDKIRKLTGELLDSLNDNLQDETKRFVLIGADTTTN